MTNQTDLIREVRAALKAATPGKWRVADEAYEDGGIESEHGAGVVWANGDSYTTVGMEQRDAYLIANSPMWLQQLTDHLEEAVKALENIQDLIHIVQGDLEIGSPASNTANLITRSIITAIRTQSGKCNGDDHE